MLKALEKAGFDLLRGMMGEPASGFYKDDTDLRSIQPAGRHSTLNEGPGKPKDIGWRVVGLAGSHDLALASAGNLCVNPRPLLIWPIRLPIEMARRGALLCLEAWMPATPKHGSWILINP
jgi:hypothetical protein